MKKKIKSTKLYKNRKGVSGVISGVFVILICFLALAAIFIYAINLDRYNQVVNERNQMDWEIQNEKFIITEAQRNGDGSLNTTLFNFGSVTAHIVDIWVTYNNASNESSQKFYRTSYFINPGETLTEIGCQNVTQLPENIEITSITLPEEVVSNINYTIKLVSKRGNSASYTIKFIPEEDEDAYGYALVIADNTDNFQYQDLNNAYHVWTMAWIKPKSNPAGAHPFYRVLLNNTTNKDISLTNGSFMHMQSTGSDTIRFIVSSATDIDDPNPTPFTNQIIASKAGTYVYFAADQAAPIVGNWKADPDVGYFQTSFLVTFNYVGETDERIITLPAQSHKVK